MGTSKNFKSNENPAFISIDGNVYDTTKFRHPGGNIFKFYCHDGNKNSQIPDASDAQHAFHRPFGRKPSLLLRSMLDVTSEINEDNKEEEALISDFRKLENELESEGFYAPSYLHVSLRLLEIFVMFNLGIFLIIAGPQYLASITIGLIILGIAQGRCGQLQHEGGHISLTNIKSLDYFIQFIVYGLGDGMSASYQRNQHNKHHAAPQRLQHDVDLDTLPLVAFNSRIASKAKGLTRYQLFFQALLFPSISTLLVALFWQFFLHPRFIWRRKLKQEALLLLSRFVLIVMLFGTQFSLWKVLVGYLFSTQIGANYIFIHFSISHTHRPVSDPSKCENWVRYASDYTTNVENSFWCNWLMGYLNFQIEHHLFPTMPQFRLPVIADRVRQLFEKHNLVYDCVSYSKAMQLTFSNLHKVGTDGFEFSDNFKLKSG